jgi:hypothetical protein
MSQENVEIVRSIHEAVNRRDWDAAFRNQRPDVRRPLGQKDDQQDHDNDEQHSATDIHRVLLWLALPVLTHRNRSSNPGA